MYKKIAQHYAQALFNISIKYDCLLQTKQQLEEFNKAIKHNEKLAYFLANSRFLKTNYNLWLVNLCRKLKFNQILIKFLSIVVTNNRGHLLKYINKELSHLYNKHNNIVEVTVHSAVNLSTTEQKQLEEVLAKKTNKIIELRMKVKSGLIAGFIIKIGDRVWNYSISGKVDNIIADLLKR